MIWWESGTVLIILTKSNLYKLTVSVRVKSYAKIPCRGRASLLRKERDQYRAEERHLLKTGLLINRSHSPMVL